MNGEFYKAENRDALSDALGSLHDLVENITRFEEQLSPEGDIGSRVDTLFQEILPEELLEKRLKELVAAADNLARDLVEKTIHQLLTISSVIKGLLHGRPGEHFDSLSNLQSIGGDENRVIRGQWDRFLDTAKDIADLLKSAKDLETSPQGI